MTEPEAWEILSFHGYRDKAGIIYHPDGVGKDGETPLIREAINYLCSEWDYGWMPGPPSTWKDIQ